MEFILLGTSLLLSVFVWECLWRKTILDHYRDELFDLRDNNLREFFLKKQSLNSEYYILTREYLNHFILHLEKFNFADYLFFSWYIRRNPDLGEFIKSNLDSAFETDDRETDLFLADIRSKSINVISRYLIFSSVILMSTVFFMVSFLALRDLFRKISTFTISSGIEKLFFKKTVVEESVQISNKNLGFGLCIS